MYPFGVAPDAQGTGLSPEGLQRVLDARYREPGIISGVGLTLSATDMSVALGGGAVAVRVASGRVTEVPISPMSVSIPAAPASGSRTDRIWVEGLTGAVRVGAAVPAGCQEIGVITVPAGATRGNQCSVGANRRFATTWGTIRGQIGAWIDPEPNDSYVIGSTTTICTFDIPVQSTDRLVDIQVHQSNWTKGANADGSTMYMVYVNGSLLHAIEIDFNQFRVQRHAHIYAVLLANQVNTIQVRRVHRAGGFAWRFRGLIDGVSYQATTVRVIDLGGTA